MKVTVSVSMNVRVCRFGLKGNINVTIKKRDEHNHE